MNIVAINKFFHHLHDTLILLGANEELANLVEDWPTIAESDVDALRRYNGELIDAAKTKMININKIAIGVVDN